MNNVIEYRLQVIDLIYANTHVIINSLGGRTPAELYLQEVSLNYTHSEHYKMLAKTVLFWGIQKLGICKKLRSTAKRPRIGPYLS